MVRQDDLQFEHYVNITKTSPCNIEGFFFSEKKEENFISKTLIFLTFLLKTLIVGTR